MPPVKESLSLKDRSLSCFAGRIFSFFFYLVVDRMLGDNVRNERSTIYKVLEQARASLVDPSRPVTPAESMRRALFNENDYRPESRPTSAFHLDGSGTSKAFFSEEEEHKYVLKHQNEGNSSNTGYGKATLRMKRKKKEAAKSSHSMPTVAPASSWGWGVEDSGNGTTEEILDTTSQPFQVTITRSRGESRGDDVPVTSACSYVDEDGESLGFSDPAYDEAMTRFRALDILEKKIVSTLDPKSSTELILLKLVALDAAINDLTLSGVNKTQWSVKREPGTTTLLEASTLARKKVMRALYRLMKKEDPHMQLCVARLVLRLATASAIQDSVVIASGHLKNDVAEKETIMEERGRVHKQIVTALRLLFSLSKDKRHDELFRKERIVHILLELLSGEAMEEGKERAKKNRPRKARVRFKLDILTYATGTLKNVCTLDAENQAIMAQQGAITTLASMLTAARSSRRTDAKVEKQVAQLLVQITGTLRNLSSDRKHLKQFWNSGVVHTLCDVLHTFPIKHSELMLNIVRILSKLSLHSSGRSRIAGEECKDPRAVLHALVRLCHFYSDHNAMLVRTCFVLGNLTSGESDTNRLHVADALVQRDATDDDVEEGTAEMGGKVELDGISVVTELLAHHTVNMIKVNILASANLKVADVKPKETAEVLVKIVRVIANLAIARSPGMRFACSRGIKCLVTLLADVKGEEHDELQLNVISAISNLSFYVIGGIHTDEQGGRQGSHFMSEEGEKVIDLMVPMLLESQHEECVLEVCRAFANFSRVQALRQYMTTVRAGEIFVVLLEHSNREVVLSVCGVLINLAACPEGKALLRSPDLNGFQKLLSVVRDAGMNDLEMSTLACKVIHNASLNGSAVAGSGELGQRNIDKMFVTLEELVEVVEDVIDEEDEHDCEDDDLMAERQFLEVATGLKRTLSVLYNKETLVKQGGGGEDSPGDLVPLTDDEEDVSNKK